MQCGGTAVWQPGSVVHVEIQQSVAVWKCVAVWTNFSPTEFSNCPPRDWSNCAQMAPQANVFQGFQILF